MAGSAFVDESTVARVTRSFTPILVDGDDPANAGFDAKYELDYYPAFVFTDLDGHVIAKLSGADDDELESTVERLSK